MQHNLTADQESAQAAFYNYLVDPQENVFILSGYSGTGKSTLVTKLIADWPAFQSTLKLIDPTVRELPINLTATTNKAAENLGQITGLECRTIHSFLGLTVVKNYETNKTYLKVRNKAAVPRCILIIDEASYIDRELLALIFQQASHCKIIFVGDPAQLIAVKASNAPVFNLQVSGAHLTETVRAKGDSPITDLATSFRHMVNTGEAFQFKPDGVVIEHLDRETFDNTIIEEFSRPDWTHRDSKYLAWTNKTVIAYNNAISNKVSGSPHFVVGDYAVCNSYVNLGSAGNIKTDEMVFITAIGLDQEMYGVMGKKFTLNDRLTVFIMNNPLDRAPLLKKLRATRDYNTVCIVEETWPDLRAVYAQTVNKSQGSTYGTVFIDLDDIGKCRDQNTLARMLYVAVSRARTKVYLTGDLV